jgi:phage shock protein PspC (stress-responsive transcriptional regulator)
MSSPMVDPPRVEGSRKLRRSRDDRMIAGVAGGLAEHLGMDPAILRLVFVVLAAAGGGGVLAYLVAWAVIPEGVEGDEPRPAGASDGSRSATAAGLTLVVLGTVLFVDLVVPGFSWRYVGPILLVALGGLLLARRDQAP